MGIKSAFNSLFGFLGLGGIGNTANTTYGSLDGYRPQVYTEVQRRTLAGRQIADYNSNGLYYIKQYVASTILNAGIRREMVACAVCLPLTKYLYDTVSNVYAVQPARKFYLTDAGGNRREIVDSLAEYEKDKTSKNSSAEKYLVDPVLFTKLCSLYNERICTSLQKAEKLTNLLNTTVYKVITKEDGSMAMNFLSNDSIEVVQNIDDRGQADYLGFVNNLYRYNITGCRGTEFLMYEQWSPTQRFIYNDGATTATGNKASDEAEALFDTRHIGDAFAPFAVFRNNIDPLNFWDVQGHDITNAIQNINVSLTQLSYLMKYSSFGLKYTVNLKAPADAPLDPTGFIQFGTENVAGSEIPGMLNGSSNFEVGEFKNDGRINEVIDSIVFQLKLLYGMFNVPLDSLVSVNSVRSAESKQLDNAQMVNAVNSQRDIWRINETNLFKVLQAVYNRDHLDKLPRGLDIAVDFDEKVTEKRTAEDWLVMITNDIVTRLDWISELNPDLDPDELKAKFLANVAQNSISSNVDDLDVGEADEEDMEDENEKEETDQSEDEDEDQKTKEG